MRVIIPCLGRSAITAQVLPEIRARAGTDDIQIVLCVDGNPEVPWHEVAKNKAAGASFADQTIVLDSHVGNGAAIQAAIINADPFVKIDSDVIPNQGWLSNLELYAQRWDNGSMGVLIGMPTPYSDKTDIGPRMQKPEKRTFLRIVYFTAKGSLAVPNHATDVPINGHDKLVVKQLAVAGLWQAYCHGAYVETHLPGRSVEYDVWKRPYLVEG
jgi:hypothetical protein